jgi:hypothetical protein
VDIQRIVAELKAERDQLDRAIAAIGGIESTGARRGRRAAAAVSVPQKRGRRSRMSAAARRKLSRLLKQRWAQGKMKQAKAPKPARRMSRAARKKIAAAQRARWAKQKAQQNKAT